MNFGIVLTVILIGYALYYVGMIIHDLYFSNKEIGDTAAIEEYEIDISEEALKFKTINVPHTELKEKGEQGSNNLNEQEEGGTTMNGGMELDKFFENARDFAENGEMSAVASLCKKWDL